MPLNETLKKKVDDLSRSNTKEKHEEVFKLLCEAIKSGDASPQDILDYTGTFWKTNPKRYVIDETVLNKLGVHLSELENTEQNKFAGHFFKISADRNCSWGCYNYAYFSIEGLESQGIPKSVESALQYAQKAVELTKTTTSHIHKLVLAMALKANNQAAEANVALAEYLNFHLNRVAKNFQKDEVKSGIQFLEETIIGFEDMLKVPIDQMGFEMPRVILTQIELFLQQNFSCSVDKETQAKIASLNQQLRYLQGRYLELSHRFPDAMTSYCSVEESSPCYKLAVIARAGLLKKTISKMILRDPLHVPVEPTAAITAELAVTSISQPPGTTKSLVAEAFVEQTSFSKYWHKGNESFDFVSQSQQEEDYKEKSTEIDTLIEAKKIEIKLLKNQLKKSIKKDEKEESEATGQLRKTISTLEGKLETLKQVKKTIDDNYEAHKPLQRQLLRRGRSESRFFNPDRFKNKAAIIALAHQIIDQRFGVNDAAKPVDLTGVPVRHLAAAEKAFQNAVIYLTSGSGVKTFIPVVRKNPWSPEYGNGSNNYGPKENYKIGETSVVFEHRENPKAQRLGDSFSPEHGNYNGDIYSFLNTLTQGDLEKGKKLARLLINYGRKQGSVLLANLKEIYPEADDTHCERFNKLCALVMAKEQVQWLSATNPTFCGLAVIHARCLLLIEKGYLTLEEVFKNNGLFSVYANTNIINDTEKLLTACERIDMLYIEHLKTLHMQDHCRMFRAGLKNDEKIAAVETKKQAHEDLRAVYGGTDESDGEGYGSDLEFPTLKT